LGPAGFFLFSKDTTFEGLKITQFGIDNKKMSAMIKNMTRYQISGHYEHEKRL
jgi:hypothetical protein